MNYFLFTLLFLVSFSYGQNIVTVSGRIQDSKTNAALPYCNISLKGKSIGTTSNESGEFTFHIPQSCLNDTLIVSMVGYHNFQSLVKETPPRLFISLRESAIEVNEIFIEAKRLNAEDIIKYAINNLIQQQTYPTYPFRLGGFYRELQMANGDRTGVVECAVELTSDRVTGGFDNAFLTQFRKIYVKENSDDQFLDWKSGRNHLLLLLLGGVNINFVTLAKDIDKGKTIWGGKKYKIERITYFNNRLVYLINYEDGGIKLGLTIDAEDYAIYKSELTLETTKENHEHYFWREVNTKGQACGAIIDYQSYEYKRVHGKMFPYLFIRKQDFRCFDLRDKHVVSSSYLSKELLINDIAITNPGKQSTGRLKLAKGLIDHKAPYDSLFWASFNLLEDVTLKNSLTKDIKTSRLSNSPRQAAIGEANTVVSIPVRIGNHSTLQFTKGDTLKGTLTNMRASYDVGHYLLDIDLDIKNELLSGFSEITFKVVKPVDRIQIDLFEGLSIHSIVSEYDTLSFERDLDAVYIFFNKTLSTNSVKKVRINYSGRPLDISPEIPLYGAFIWLTDPNGRPWIQSVCQGYGSSGWWPSKNHLSDKPDSTTIRFTIPDSLIGVSNGRLISVKKAENGKTTYAWSVSYPISNYNIAISAGDYFRSENKITGSDRGRLDFDLYALKQDSSIANRRLEMVSNLVRVYEKYFGSYPFVEDGFKIIQAPYAMEHQSCVSIGQNFDEKLILHEVAHEWWGNSVSCTDYADIWINEAFATYAESLYIEETLGREIGKEYLNAMKGSIENDYPLQGVYGVNHIHYPIGDKYTKGALLLNTVRYVVNNDSLWFNTLKSLQNDFRYSFITTDQLIAYLNQNLGYDYSFLFAQFLQGTQIPTLEVNIKQIDNKQIIDYRWQGATSNFKMPVRMTAKKGELSFIYPTTSWNRMEVGDMLIEDFRIDDTGLLFNLVIKKM